MLIFIFGEIIFAGLLLYSIKTHIVSGKRNIALFTIIMQIVCITLGIFAFIGEVLFPQLLMYLVVAQIGITISHKDIMTKTIDSVLMYSLFIVGVIYSFFSDYPFYSHIITGAVVFLLMLMIFYLGKKQIGFGDVKLIAVYGLIWSYPNIFNVLFYALIMCLIGGAIIAVKKKGSLKTEIPFAPFLIAGHTLSAILLCIYL